MFKAVHSREGEVVKLSLHGRLDGAATPVLKRTAEGLLEAGLHRIVMHCDELEYVSSAGLRVFMVLAKKIRKLKGGMAISGMRPEVHRVFELCELTRIFTICATFEDARDKVRSDSFPQSGPRP